MKILIYSMQFWPEPTGIGKYSGDMALWLSHHGHEIRVICSPPWYPHWKVQEPYSGARFQREQVNGVTIDRCPAWIPAHPSGFTRILCLASFAISSLVASFRAFVWRPDLVFSVEPPFFCLPVALILARLTGAKAWLHIQDFEVDAALQLGLFRIPGSAYLLRWVETFLFRRFDRCSTISEMMLELLKNRRGQSESCLLFRNWVDLTTIYPLEQPSQFRQLLDLKPYQQVALYAGNMGEKQGLEIIIDAANILKYRDDLVFVLCGNGAAAERIRAMGTVLSNIRWLPVQPTEQLNSLLNLADVHLLPQRADAADLVMPSKLTGMLASGRTIVATASPGTQIYDIVSRCGLTTTPGDVQAFAAAIMKLSDELALRVQLGIRAREIAESELCMETILTNIEEQLRQVCTQTD
jgi:colanic acid biosynthesis glycosyl transferase WcaI